MLSYFHYVFFFSAKYLGMTLDAQLRWKAHVKKKRERLDLRYKKVLVRRKELPVVPP